MYLLFSKSTKEVSSVALSKHVPHYGPRSGFRIISWRPLPQSREIPLSDTQESTVQLCRFEPLESLHLYPGKDKYNISIKKIYLYKINMTMFWFWLIIVYILLSHAFTSSLYAPFFEVLYRNFALDFHGLLVWVCIYIDCLSLMCQSIPWKKMIFISIFYTDQDNLLNWLYKHFDIYKKNKKTFCVTKGHHRHGDQHHWFWSKSHFEAVFVVIIFSDMKIINFLMSGICSFFNRGYM